MGIMRALLLAFELLTGGLALQPAKTTLLARGEQATHAEHLTVGKSHCMDHASVDPDRRARVRGHHDEGFLDPEIDVPPEWILDQAGAGDPPKAAMRNSG